MAERLILRPDLLWRRDVRATFSPPSKEVGNANRWWNQQWHEACKADDSLLKRYKELAKQNAELSRSSLYVAVPKTSPAHNYNRDVSGFSRGLVNGKYVWFLTPIDGKQPTWYTTSKPHAWPDQGDEPRADEPPTGNPQACEPSQHYVFETMDAYWTQLLETRTVYEAWGDILGVVSKDKVSSIEVDVTAFLAQVREDFGREGLRMLVTSAVENPAVRRLVVRGVDDEELSWSLYMLAPNEHDAFQLIL